MRGAREPKVGLSREISQNKETLTSTDRRLLPCQRDSKEEMGNNTHGERSVAVAMACALTQASALRKYRRGRMEWCVLTGHDEAGLTPTPWQAEHQTQEARKTTMKNNPIENESMVNNMNKPNLGCRDGVCVCVCVRTCVCVLARMCV